MKHRAQLWRKVRIAIRLRRWRACRLHHAAPVSARQQQETQQQTQRYTSCQQQSKTNTTVHVQLPPDLSHQFVNYQKIPAQRQNLHYPHGFRQRAQLPRGLFFACASANRSIPSAIFYFC
jgi:hypothetical protein